jgi:hypothetical protein
MIERVAEIVDLELLVYSVGREKRRIVVRERVVDGLIMSLVLVLKDLLDCQEFGRLCGLRFEVLARL